MNLRKAFIAYYTIVYNEVRRTLRIWPQTVLPAAITTILYFLIFGHLMGQRIGQMSGLPYIVFIVPGLIMMTMLMSAFSATVSTVFMYKWRHVLDEVLVSPMSSVTILNSYMCVGIIRAIIVGIIVTIIAIVFTQVRIDHIVYMLFIAILACAIFSLFGIINGLYAKTFDHVAIVPTFVITPLSYLGGVFYSLTILPAFWQKVALFNPVIYIISTFRFAFYGTADTNILMSTLTMFLFFIVLYLICLYMIKNRVGISS